MDGGFKITVKTKGENNGNGCLIGWMVGDSSHMKNESVIMEQCTWGGVISNDRGFKTM